MLKDGLENLSESLVTTHIPLLGIFLDKLNDFDAEILKEKLSLPSNHFNPIFTIPAIPPKSSSMSPYNPLSPLNPDGIINQDWVAKHKSQIPSCIIAFYSLFNVSNPDPLLLSNTERQVDSSIIDDILEKKRIGLDRGIKYFIALYVDDIPDSILEERINYIRKSTNIDFKSIYIHKINENIDDFISLIQKSLFESSLNYYREHIKRIRKKRQKTSTNIPKSSRIGTVVWNIRYDFKLAVFSEFRQEFESAIKLYESCYLLIVDLFNNSVDAALVSGVAFTSLDSLIPFSDRWNELKVFVDSLSIKVFLNNHRFANCTCCLNLLFLLLFNLINMYRI